MKKTGSKKIEIRVEVNGELVYVEQRENDGKMPLIPIGKLIMLHRKRMKNETS